MSLANPPVHEQETGPVGETSPIGDAATPRTSRDVPPPRWWPAAWMLARREWVRFFRQRNRVTAAVVQPLLFWVLFGLGMQGAFEAAGGLNFLEFFLPGTLALILLFTAIFSTISVIEDRREGFMQSVLVAPVGRFPVLVGKVLGGSAIAWVQATFFLLLIYVFGTAPFVLGNLIPLLSLMALVAVGMCALGMIVAWPMESTQGFHAIMMLFLMPMWLLAGTFFPIPAFDQSVGGAVLGGIMRANPLSYAIAEMRRLIYPSIASADLAFAPPPTVCWLVTVLSVGMLVVVAWWAMRGSRKADVVV